MLNLSRNHLVAESTLGDVVFQVAIATDGINLRALTDRLRISSAC
jgi:hypothetical protein